MEYQKNSRRSHDSIIEAVGVWVGFAPELLYSSALEPRLVLLPAQLGELFQALAVLGLGPWQSCHTGSVVWEGAGIKTTFVLF